MEESALFCNFYLSICNGYTVYAQKKKKKKENVVAKNKTYFLEIKSFTVKSTLISGFQLMKTDKKKQCMAKMESSIDPKAFQASALV